MKKLLLVANWQLLLAALILTNGVVLAMPTSKDTTKFAESNVEVPSKFGELYGTLCVPVKKQGKPVLAIIIAGSGPTDRNGNSIYLKSDAYKMLAHELALNNIATVRYDKRGVGESESSLKKVTELTFDIMVDDVRSFIDKYSGDSRFSKIVIIGHSQGSLVGILASQKPGVNAFISLAGIGENGGAVIKRQLSAQPKEIQELAFPIIDTLLVGHKVDSIPQVLMVLFKPSGQPLLINWFKYSPTVEIAKLSIPVLIIQGTNDIQVEVADAKLLHEANKKSKLEIITNMNHLLKIVVGDKTANMATYNNPALPISDELVTKLVFFIHNIK